MNTRQAIIMMTCASLLISLSACSTPNEIIPTQTVIPSTSTPTPSATFTPSPIPPTATPDTPDYIIISRADLMALPTSGAAWDTVKSKADASATPDLCNQHNKADVNALAAGIVYARTGNEVYRTKAISLINAAIASQRDGCSSAVLAISRQLGGYVMAADFANYRDPSFLSWLEMIVDHTLGGHGRWNELRFTAYDSANNWGTFSLTSVLAVDIFLNKTTNIEKDWQVFSAYGIPHGWPFLKQAAYDERWSCVASDSSGNLPIALNIPCVKDGVNLDGAPVADALRATFPAYSSYIQESLQGYVVMAQLFERTGRAGWTVNDSQICRASQFAGRSGTLNVGSVSYYASFMANHFCGLSLPTKTPTGSGRLFGFSDWLFSGSTTTPIPVSPSVTLPEASYLGQDYFTLSSLLWMFPHSQCVRLQHIVKAWRGYSIHPHP